MSQPPFHIPEPSTPEHELVKSIGELPRLSPNLRDRVLNDCRFQIRYGRRLDQLRVLAMATLLLMLTLVLGRQLVQWLSTPAPATQPQPLPTTPVSPAIVPTRELVPPGQSLSQPTHP